MIKAITNLKIGVNSKMLFTLYSFLIQTVLLYAGPVLLLACISALQSLEIIQRVPLRYISGLPNDTSPILVYGESGILSIRLLIKRETTTYLVRKDTKPIDPLHDDVINQNKPVALCIVGFIGGPLSDNTVIIPPF